MLSLRVNGLIYQRMEAFIETVHHASPFLFSFRHFIEHYLMRHPEVNTGRWLMARQLDPTPHGLPVEVYFYFTEREFVRYEHLAADCMEHFIAMMPEFGLRAYQAPTGYDFTQIN